ncbi:alkaline phosphatase family protein [Pseudomonas sp. RHF3.3-3]|uniref:alkaline phosphatase family protein n=1 Tax=Pseudomonas sp. RHF3.3-3 TaxID=3396624 RepID=UPI003A87A584
MDSQKLKLLFFGVDGASYTVMKDLMTRGLLPNFSALAAQGGQGVLQSTFPPHTAPGWASMFTGVSPGEHGIYQFWATQSPDYRFRAMNAADYGREPCWLALERQGLKVGVYNIPMTHPPVGPAGGYMISWPLAKTLRYTAPSELMHELMQADMHYHSDIVTMYRGQEDYCEQAAKFIRGRAETCNFLQRTRPVDALFVVFTEVDRVSHYYWGDQERPGQEVEDCYIEVDRALGQVMSLADDDTLVMVASDHGFGLCHADFSMHEFLLGHDLLACRHEPVAPASTTGSDDPGVRSWFDAPGLYRRTVDWSRTSFYMPTPGCFGLNANLQGREAQGYLDQAQLPAAEERLRGALAELVDEQGQPWFTLVKRDEVYAGDSLDQAPDYLLIPKDFTVMPTPSLNGAIWNVPAQRGVHRPDGVLFVRGPKFPPNGALQARIEDVFPTILAHLGLAVPEGLDGHWLIDPVREPVREDGRRAASGRRMSEQEQQFMDGQLQQIGYF